MRRFVLLVAGPNEATRCRINIGGLAWTQKRHGSRGCPYLLFSGSGLPCAARWRGCTAQELEADTNGYTRIHADTAVSGVYPGADTPRIRRGYAADTADTRRIRRGYRGYTRIPRYPRVSARIRVYLASMGSILYILWLNVMPLSNFMLADSIEASKSSSTLLFMSVDATAAPTLQENTMVPVHLQDEMPVDEVCRCSRCGSEILEAESIAAQKHSSAQPTCKSCHALVCLVTRNASDILHSLNQDAQVEFFKKMHELRKASGGLLRWKLVRPQLIETMTKQAITECRDGVGGAYQPLAYYRQKGYDVESIEKQCPFEEHPVLGRTYLLRIHHIDETSISRSVEERMARAEMDVQRRHIPCQQPARKATKTKPASDAIPLTEEEKRLASSLEDLIDLVSDSEDQPVKVAKPRGGGEAAAKAEAKKAEKEKQKIANKMTLLAHKAVSLLKPVLDKMGRIDEQSKRSKLYDELDCDTKEIWDSGVKEATDAMGKVFAALEKSKKEPLTSDDLPFAVDKDITMLVKASRSSMEAMNHFKSERAKKKKAERAAEKGGA